MGTPLPRMLLPQGCSAERPERPASAAGAATRPERPAFRGSRSWRAFLKLKGLGLTTWTRLHGIISLEAYGYRRTWKALRRAGEIAPRCQVQRLMRAHGIQGAKRRGKPWRTTRPDLSAHRRPDPVRRQFTAEEPNRLWVGDLSSLRRWEGVVFYASIIDVHSRKVIGWQLASHMQHRPGP